MVLAAFKNIVRAGSRAEVLRALADAGHTVLGAPGVAVVTLQPGGDAGVVGMVEARGLPERLAGWRAEVDVIDAEIGDRLLVACEGRFRHAHTLPLMSGGDLFGALVLFLTDADEATAWARDAVPAFHNRMAAAEALTDLAAVAVGKAEQYEALSRSYAELRASRAALERTEKLRALGQMAAGISHDLKNILNPLSLHLQLLKRILKRGGQGAEEAVAEMEQVVRRGVDTVERLRDFSRQAPESRMERVHLDALVHEAVELGRPRMASMHRSADGQATIPRSVRLVEALGAPPHIQARASEVVAALLNLVSNAIDALQGMDPGLPGGTVTVSTGAGDGGAWVCVRDDGPGIPEEIQARIFEPFFTTKGAEGTGLGLAMVYAFVHRHGGKLTLDSAPGRGTAFTLWFPVATGGDPPYARPAADAPHGDAG